MQRRRSWLGLGMLLLAAGGCALSAGGNSGPAAQLPADEQVRRDQLVVHSNFAIPRHHRLLDELIELQADVSRKLAVPVSNEPVHIYLFETASQYRAYVKAHLPHFPERRACFVESDAGLAIYAQWSELIAIDLRHEVTHGYMHAVVRNLPLWIDEGLAEYFEVGRELGGVNSGHAHLLKSSRSRGDWTADLARLEALELPGEMGQLHYAESWAWMHWLLETTPQRRRLLEDYLARLRMTGEAPPLSQYILESEPDAVALLQQHVLMLAG